MKKTLLSLFALATVGAYAQLPNGTTAPDFTANDVFGNSHSLYADYLNQGKSVFLNISATWCPPCWNYHNTHALSDFYEAYGPNGSDEAAVLYVEGDPSTPVNALFGIGANTLGNWVEGTPYPIIDNASIANLYQIPYWPTMYRICSDTKTVTELSQLTAPNLRNNFSSNCGTLTGVPNHVKISGGDIYSCSQSGGVATFPIRNYGNNNLTQAVVVLKENGSVIATQNFTGNVAQFNSANVAFSGLNLDTSATYSVEIQSVNGGAVHHSPYAIAEVGSVNIAQEVQETSLEVRVYTDNYPTEARWRIKNSAGEIVASGGPYSGPANGGGPDANTTKVHNITIPATADCYSVELLDQYGDGWGYNSAAAPNSGLEVFENGTSIVFVDGSGSFSNTIPLVRPSAFVYGTMSTDDLQRSKFSVYPNPSTGIFNVSTTEMVNVNVVDITGKIVYQANGLDNNAMIDLSSLQRGVYLIQVSGETIKTTEKLILN